LAWGRAFLCCVPKARALGPRFSVIYDFWAANYVGFNGDAMRRFAAEFLSLAEKQAATVPIMVGHRLMGGSLATTGELSRARAHYDQAIPLYDPVAHRPLATRFSRHSGSNFEFSNMDTVVVRLPGRRPCGRGSRA